MDDSPEADAAVREHLWRQAAAHSILDPSFWTLLGANLLTLSILLIEDAPVAEILWIYWSQSVVIGAFHHRKILDLREFTTTGLKFNDVSVDPTPDTQRRVARFFAIHYGFFHVMYGVFLAAMHGLPVQSSWIVLVGGAVFLLNHGYSFLENRESDRSRRRNLGLMLFSPYGRIVPMHLAIIVGGAIGSSTGVLVLFVLLKTAVDLAGHTVGHVVRANPELLEAELARSERAERSG